jgi:hypothetical protein
VQTILQGCKLLKRWMPVFAGVGGREAPLGPLNDPADFGGHDTSISDTGACVAARVIDSQTGTADGVGH